MRDGCEECHKLGAPSSQQGKELSLALRYPPAPGCYKGRRRGKPQVTRVDLG